MIEALKEDAVIHSLGGRFKFTALVHHRVRELMDGARPLVERNGRNDLEVAIDEVVQGKIGYKLQGTDTVVAARRDAAGASDATAEAVEVSASAAGE